MRVVALSGGVGGARLVDGLAANLAPTDLTVVVNTGDDFAHLGLWISPDLDTVMYTLAGVADPERGWGLLDERFSCLDALKSLGGPTWFQLGDRDLATHLMRTEWLQGGVRLTEVTRRLCRALGVPVTVLPMADAPRPTKIEVEGEVVAFQDWLVVRHAPPLRSVFFEGTTSPTSEVIEALAAADLVVLTPSNPYVSLDPILTLDGVVDQLRMRRVVAVSPIVHGMAVKGPLATMIPVLSGMSPSTAAVAAHYGELVDHWVVEYGDLGGLTGHETRTVMTTREDRIRLAAELLAV